MDASDEFIHKRIMNLPEKLVQDTHNTEEGLSRRLLEYRQFNNEDETVTNVFEEEFELKVIKLVLRYWCTTTNIIIVISVKY